MMWSTVLALGAIVLLARLGGWYRSHLAAARAQARPGISTGLVSPLSRGKVALALAVLVALIFSKYVYLVSLTSYYTFYLIERFSVTVQAAQIYLFIFLFAVAAGTIIGGPVRRSHRAQVRHLGFRSSAWLHSPSRFRTWG